MWSSLEKFAYPDWFDPLVDEKPFLTFGLPREVFVPMAGVAEFTMGFGLLWTPLVRRLSAIALFVIFTAAVYPFGRTDLIGHALPICPSAFDWKLVADADSMYNTPPTYGIYIAGLVFAYLKRQGGVAEIEKRNIAKAELLYAALDADDFYQNRVAKDCRSRMNVPFYLRDESLNEKFLAGAKARGLLQLKGHKSVGGMRASIYNAMSIDGVQSLVDYLNEFAGR